MRFETAGTPSGVKDRHPSVTASASVPVAPRGGAKPAPWPGLKAPNTIGARLRKRARFSLFIRLPLGLLLRVPTRSRGRQEMMASFAAPWIAESAGTRMEGQGRERRHGLAAAVGAAICAVSAVVLSSPWVTSPWSGPSEAQFRLPPATAGRELPVPPVLADASSLVALPPMAAWTRYPGEIVTSDTMQGDAPNPFILQVGKTYYMYSSQGNVLAVHANIPLRTSTDLRHWSAPTDAMPTMPSWARTGLNWAPDVHFIAGRFVMWFSAVTQGINHPRTGDGLMKCIGWATATSPSGPFVPDPGDYPPVCQVSHHGSIDPHVFLDPDGSYYLVYKSDDNASTDPTTKTTIWSQQLGPDGTSLVGDPTALVTPDQPWQGRVVENGQMVFANGSYWLFYSSNSFSSPAYSIDYDRCSGPVGPCSDPTILMGSNAQGQGPGEAEVFIDDDLNVWMVYAPWAQDPKGYSPRPVALVRLGFDAAGPYLAAP